MIQPDLSMQLSILIVSWSERGLLERCLAAVQHSTAKTDAEVIVVDNGSDDGSADLVARAYPRVHLIRNDHNWGYAHANNQAYQASTGEFILLLNTDAILTKDALEKMLARLREAPGLGGTTPRFLNADGSTQYGYHRRRSSVLRLIGAFLHNGKAWKRNRWAREYFRLDDDFRTREIIEQPAGTCWLLRRTAIEQSGGLFDAQRYPIHFNDVDFAERLRRKSWKTELVPGAAIVHAGGSAVKHLDPYLAKELYLVSQLYYFRTWRPFGEYVGIKLFFALVCVVYLVLTRLNLVHWYFTAPITDRHASFAAQLRIFRALLAERLPPGWVPKNARSARLA